MNTHLYEYEQTAENTRDTIKRECFDVSYPSGTLYLGSKTYVMGILNVTPDSFYDGKRYDAGENAIEHALKMTEEGADIIDVGGESTKAWRISLSEEEEK